MTNSVTIMGLLMAAVICAGCGGEPAAGRGFELVIGGPGHVSGRFHRPRGIVWSEAEAAIYVVDWGGRIQKFGADGGFRASWLMPAIEKGKPEDLCMNGRGNLLVADTHYSRIVEFTPRGELVGGFGSYGTGHGQFIYPVGVVCDTNGNVYVSEYGENDRIQKFAPDGTFVSCWGSFGTATGQFQRPSGIDISPDGRLFVADAVNHRLQVFDLDGKLLSVIGREGTGPGEFRYPYDVSVASNALYVVEYGNQRVQKLAMDGAPLKTMGRPGAGDGCFAWPWRCEVVEDSLYVSDTENGRVVKLGSWF